MSKAGLTVTMCWHQLKVDNTWFIQKKRWVFERLCKTVFEVIVLSSYGSAFQALGAATMNALSAVRVLVLAMTKSPRLVESHRSSVQTLHRSSRYAARCYVVASPTWLTYRPKHTGRHCRPSVSTVVFDGQQCRPSRWPVNRVVNFAEI